MDLSFGNLERLVKDLTKWLKEKLKLSSFGFSNKKTLKYINKIESSRLFMKKKKKLMRHISKKVSKDLS